MNEREKFEARVKGSKELIENFNDFYEDNVIAWAGGHIKKLEACAEQKDKEIAALKAEVKKLEEYKFMYESVSK